MIHSTANAPAIYVPPDEWDDGDCHPPGAFTIETLSDGTRELLYNCPSDGVEGLLRLRPCGSARPSWEFNGDLQSPTLTPSVHRIAQLTAGGTKTIWHGWLRDGQWVSC